MRSEESVSHITHIFFPVHCLNLPVEGEIEKKKDSDVKLLCLILAFLVVLQKRLYALRTWAENPAHFPGVAQTGPTCSSTMPSPARAMWLAGSTTASFLRVRPSSASGAKWGTGISFLWTGQEAADAKDDDNDNDDAVAAAADCSIDANSDGDHGNDAGSGSGADARYVGDTVGVAVDRDDNNVDDAGCGGGAVADTW